MKHYSETITINPNIRFGKPYIRGTRITVYDILSWYASGMTANEIIGDYPELTDEDVKAAFLYPVWGWLIVLRNSIYLKAQT